MRWIFALVGALAALAGGALWYAMRPPAPASEAVAMAVAPAALLAAAFTDLEGRKRSLGEFQGRVVVLNFWATWCAPCREEMPGFDRLQAQWEGRVQFVGVSAEEPAKVAPFARALGIRYPLWVGGDEVGELSRRLGNRRGVLPHTVVLDPSGGVITGRVGAYKEAELQEKLREFMEKRR
jgi:thiol-disulfide isomerase/thioredoxin